MWRKEPNHCCAVQYCQLSAHTNEKFFDLSVGQETENYSQFLDALPSAFFTVTGTWMKCRSRSTCTAARTTDTQMWKGFEQTLEHNLSEANNPQKRGPGPFHIKFWSYPGSKNTSLSHGWNQVPCYCCGGTSLSRRRPGLPALLLVPGIRLEQSYCHGVSITTSWREPTEAPVPLRSRTKQKNHILTSKRTLRASSYISSQIRS